jgi:predicted nucleic acid-binding protein
MTAAYLDSSAIVKLVVEESETAALRRTLGAWPRRISSELAIVEVMLAARRRSVAAERVARRVLAGLTLVAVDRDVLDAAAAVAPELRALDAVHVATATTLAGAVDVVLTYDARMARAAGAAGLTVAAPA